MVLVHAESAGILPHTTLCAAPAISMPPSKPSPVTLKMARCQCANRIGFGQKCVEVSTWLRERAGSSGGRTGLAGQLFDAVCTGSRCLVALWPGGWGAFTPG
jgi:hypothetical protein